MEPGPPGDARPGVWNWPLPPLVQAGPPPKVKLSPFWKNKPIDWFILAESTFDRNGVVNRRHRFDLVLPALAEDILDRVSGVLAAAIRAVDPYELLKDRLLELFTPDEFDRINSLLFAAELGDRRPSDMMDWMLATLPPGEPEGLFVKGIFLTRLPEDIRSLVQPQAKTLECRQLAAYADQLWIARNSRKSGHSVMAVMPPGDVLGEKLAALEGAVAALAVSKQGKKRPANRRGHGGGSQAASGQEKGGWLCRRHAEFGEAAFKCNDPKFCAWSGNGHAGQ